METPNFTPSMFVNASGLNNAFANVSGSIAEVANGVFAVPGLISPESIAITFTGASATVTLSNPFALLTSSGTFIQGHGVVNNANTQTYTVAFNSLFPGTGSVTAYLLAQASAIYQNPVAIVAPPPGHPSYNASFVPTGAYTTYQNTLNLYASTGVANNTTTFELGRCTLVAGATGVSGFTTAYQKRATVNKTNPPYIVTTSGPLPVGIQNYTAINYTYGITSILPPASASTGLTITAQYANTTYVAPYVPFGSWNIVTTSGDVIYSPVFNYTLGSGSLNPYAPPTNFILNAFTSASFWSDGIVWRLTNNTYNSMSSGSLNPLLPAANAPIGTISASGWRQHADGYISQWAYVQLSDAGAIDYILPARYGYEWVFPTSFIQGVGQRFRATNMALVAGQAPSVSGIPVSGIVQFNTFQQGAVNVTVTNTGAVLGTSCKVVFLLEAEGY